MTRPHFARTGALVVAAAVLAGCSAEAATTPTMTEAIPSSEASSAPTPAATSQAPIDYPAPVTTRELSPDGLLTDFYRDGQMATLRVPSTKGPAPMVVIVPGGGWLTSDPTDYQPLAQALTANGITTSLITYDTSASGARFPLPIDDVACAARWSAYQLNALGYPPTEVILAGHSAGGQLAVEVAATGDRFGGDCPWPPVTIDRVIGMSGVYDLSNPALPEPQLFEDGGSAEERAQYSPINTVNDPDTPVPSTLKVLLISGANDVIVPAVQSEQMAAAFRARGIEPTVNVLPLEHRLGFPLALEVSPIVLSWILGPAYTPSPTPTPEAPPPPAASAPPVDPASPAPVAPVDPAASPVASPPAG